MIEDKELINIWNEKENSVIKCKKYEDLSLEDKTRIFDLIMKNKHIQMKGG